MINYQSTIRSEVDKNALCHKFFHLGISHMHGIMSGRKTVSVFGSFMLT